MAYDRVDEDEIRLTQEFLSEMIGVRRPGVTVIALVDRTGLLAHSCECYGTVEDEWERVMGRTVRKGG